MSELIVWECKCWTENGNTTLKLVKNTFFTWMNTTFQPQIDAVEWHSELIFDGREGQMVKNLSQIITSCKSAVTESNTLSLWPSAPLLSLWLFPYLWWQAGLLLLITLFLRLAWEKSLSENIVGNNKPKRYLCFVRHLYVLNPSSAETFLIWSSPLGRTTYFPSKEKHR